MLRSHDQGPPGSQGRSDDGSWSHDVWPPVQLVITHNLSSGLKKLFNEVCYIEWRTEFILTSYEFENFDFTHLFEM